MAKYTKHILLFLILTPAFFWAFSKLFITTGIIDDLRTRDVVPEGTPKEIVDEVKAFKEVQGAALLSPFKRKDTDYSWGDDIDFKDKNNPFSYVRVATWNKVREISPDANFSLYMYLAYKNGIGTKPNPELAQRELSFCKKSDNCSSLVKYDINNMDFDEAFKFIGGEYAANPPKVTKQGDLTLFYETEMLRSGLGTPADEKKSFDKLQKYCFELKDIRSCESLGQLLYANPAKPEEVSRSIAAYDVALDGLNHLDEDEWGLDENRRALMLSKLMVALTPAILKSNPNTAYVMAKELCKRRNVNGNLANLKWNIPIACDILGRLNLFGYGTPKNAQEAEKLFGLSCLLGEWRGCYHLEIMNEMISISDDVLDASDHYKKLCSAGDPKACVNLGRIYWETMYPGENFNRSVKLFEWACAKGEPTGCAPLDPIPLLQGFNIPGLKLTTSYLYPRYRLEVYSRMYKQSMFPSYGSYANIQYMNLFLGKKLEQFHEGQIFTEKLKDNLVFCNEGSVQSCRMAAWLEAMGYLNGEHYWDSRNDVLRPDILKASFLMRRACVMAGDPNCVKRYWRTRKDAQSEIYKKLFIFR